jgi:hypothetical protein
MSLYGVSIVRDGEIFTFESLAEAPIYSIKGAPYLDVIATADFAGEPWEVFEANGFVYDFQKDLIVQSELITDIVEVNQSGNYFFADGLLKSGSVTQNGDEIKSYIGWFSDPHLRFRYSEITYAD